MIIIKGLRSIAQRLDRTNIEDKLIDALQAATHSMEAGVNAAAMAFRTGGESESQLAREPMISSVTPRDSNGLRASVHVRDAMLMAKEFGSPGAAPRPILSAVARQSGRSTAEDIGRIFVQCLSRNGND